ncbi:hypothetical protein [Cellulophaga fucicola]|uniref:Membrane metalloprotease n=1 Tax=Cellulophaga fucicola TaxID=76595 RepID=A0A1K1NZV3_9FLAO|nr:hypothetical protein [Cellulophaga fucicola]SFW40733.1 hypothetical protein SAMN05660313_01479 [Cellulophaga fucicola]
MKKFSALLLSVLLFASCSSTDDSDKQSEGQIKKTANLQGSGDSANDILSNNTFSKLSLEIAYVKGFKPADETLINFTDFIKSITFKNDIAIKLVELDSPNEEDLTTEEVAKLETENRTIYNSDDTLAIYIYFADAPSNNDDEDTNSVTLGAVYRNTSMVIYEATIKKLANKSALISETSVETSTLNHELGHLMGLVNLGTEMVHPHEGETTNEDNETVGSNHCNIDNCLMNAELEFGSGMKKMLIASKNGIPELDAECLADLKANGGR